MLQNFSGMPVLCPSQTGLMLLLMLSLMLFLMLLFLLPFLLFLLFLLFFNDMNFQRIKVYGFNKAVLSEARFCMQLEIIDVGIQPDRATQIELTTDVLYCLKDHSGARLIVIPVCDDRIFYHMIVFPDFSPHTKHKNSPFWLWFVFRQHYSGTEGD